MAAAVARHFVHHDRRFGYPEARAAKFFGHGDAQPSAFGHGLVKLEREDAVFVAREPIFVVELRHNGANALANDVALFLSRERAG